MVCRSFCRFCRGFGGSEPGRAAEVSKSQQPSGAGRLGFKTPAMAPIGLQHITVRQLGAFEPHQAAEVGAAGLVGQAKVPALPAIWRWAWRVGGVGHKGCSWGGNQQTGLFQRCFEQAPIWSQPWTGAAWRQEFASGASSCARHDRFMFQQKLADRFLPRVPAGASGFCLPTLKAQSGAMK
jgi:hypothetical protein